jgi:sialate O-acetylesterase
MVWYQGESNADSAQHYGRLFREMIHDWRTKWGSYGMPFYFAQLPGYGPGATWPELRAAQAEALELPGTAMAVAIDLGDRDDIHPLAKEALGTRLALLALKHSYGHHELNSEGPAIIQVKSLLPHCVDISFTNAEGLYVSGAGSLVGFEAAGTDGGFIALPPATIIGSRVRLTEVPADAAHIRFGWAAFPRRTSPIATACPPRLSAWRFTIRNRPHLLIHEHNGKLKRHLAASLERRRTWRATEARARG